MSVKRSITRRTPLVAVVAAATVTGLMVLGAPGGASAGTSGSESTYVVLYAAGASTAGAAGAVGAAGGTVVANYTQIGVVVARSASTGFAATMKSTAGVQGVSATDRFATRLTDELAGDAPTVTAASSATEPLAGLQWDMRQIHAPEAHQVTAGSADVVVGDIDTGLDYTHPDLAPNVDFSRSVSCLGGVPDQSPAAWDDENGHGTHTAGTIAAAVNGIGIAGVAPGVRIAGIRAGNADGYFFPEAVICSFVWAAEHGIAVTNNSYFADPWLFNCKNDPGQRAIWNAERRAIRYAQAKGVVVVAAEGNENLDLSRTNTDTISPDYPPGSAEERIVTNACSVVPVEVPGVVGVTADGNLRQKSYYSSYGQATADVVAPGGDRRFQLTAEAPNGRVLSTYPAKFYTPSPLIVRDCSVSPCAVYAYLQGTSMASPHVAGVAALVRSEFPALSAGAVAARVQSRANPLACPPNPFDPGGTGAFLATCVGGLGHNGFYGSGEVDALAAVG